VNLNTDQRRVMLSRINSNNEKNYNIYSYLTLLYILIFDYFLFEELIPGFARTLFPYGIFFFLFSFLFSAQLFRLFRRLELGRENLTGFGKVGLIAIGALTLFVFYYVIVSSFAYTIFPGISNARGGANYANAPSISIFVEHPALLKNPNFVLSEGQLQNLVLLYSTSASFFFGTCDWRRGPAAILEVRRDEVKYLVTNATTRIPDCP
jgi:hypothetical protein